VAQVAVCSEIDTKQINTVWADFIIKCLTPWCTKPEGFKRSTYTVKFDPAGTAAGS